MTREDDLQVIEIQIGRPLRATSDVVARCHLGLPVVVRVPPILDDGTPFPTLFWLTCPLARSRVGRLEAGGGVKRMDAKAESDDSFARDLQAAHASYAELRDSLVPPDVEPAPSGGVGGAAAGVKCLHAHLAHHLAGGDNPVGALVDAWISPLDCEVPCVLEGEPNPAWVSRP